MSALSPAKPSPTKDIQEGTFFQANGMENPFGLVKMATGDFVRIPHETIP